MTVDVSKHGFFGFEFIDSIILNKNILNIHYTCEKEKQKVKIEVRSGLPGTKGNKKEEIEPIIIPAIIIFLICFLFTKNKSHGHIK